MRAGLNAYRQVLADPKARAFTAAGLVARLPMSMSGIGIVLLVSLTSGSFGRAGLVTAVVFAGSFPDLRTRDPSPLPDTAPVRTAT